MKNIIICADSIEYMAKIPDNSVDLIFADPPYWMRVEGVLKRPEGKDFNGCNDKWDSFSSDFEYNEFSKKWLGECKRILKANGSFWVIGSMQCIYTIGAIMQELGFWFINDVIWQKSNPTPNFMGTRLNNSHETLIWATKSKKSKFTFNYKTAKELNSEDNLFESKKQMGSVWKFPVCSGAERLKDENGEKLHSTQKPLALLERIVAISSKIGDLVFDPFGGTGTTAHAAKMLGRDFFLIEKEQKYVNFALKRLENVKFIQSDIASAKFDEKPLKVSIDDMINAGFLFLDEKFYLKNTNEFAILKNGAKLEFNGEFYDIHSLAAKLKNSSSQRLNGFKFWQVKRDDKFILLDDVRQNFREKIIA